MSRSKHTEVQMVEAPKRMDASPSGERRTGSGRRQATRSMPGNSKYRGIEGAAVKFKIGLSVFDPEGKRIAI